MVPNLSPTFTRTCVPNPLRRLESEPVAEEEGPQDCYTPYGPGGSDELRLIPKPTPQAREYTPLRQSNGKSCGQTSVAMAVNYLTGQSLKDTDIDHKYQFRLLKALNDETKPKGYHWQDGGDMGPGKWPMLEKTVNQGLPALVALNGPRFSPSGNGHIVLLVGLQGDRVEYLDPATKKREHCTRQDMERAGRHPQGNFIFYPKRV